MSVKKVMLDHSQAKVELYKLYLGIYLNILQRTDWMKKIYLYDLFAGEGQYEDGGKGSPIATMETIKEHFFTNGKKCIDIDVWFNDNGYSEIEKGTLKIDRIKKLCDNIYRPENVNVTYTNLPYTDIQTEVVKKLSKLNSNERALLFIDPYGYKEFHIDFTKRILDNNKSEILLFVPIYFMHRFASSAIKTEFTGSEPLRNILTILRTHEEVVTKSQIAFIDWMKRALKIHLQKKWITTFTIEREKGNFFSLFFFTSNEKGFEKMLDAKWQLDEAQGRGFKIVQQPTLPLFEEVEARQYDEQLYDFVKRKGQVTNRDVYYFGLENEFLPKHSTEVLQKLKKDGKIECLKLDGTKAQGFYISEKEMKAIIKAR